LKGIVDMTSPRYFCEKHFSQRYISNQSRRKMLVHTAIPEKYKSNLDPPAYEYTLVSGDSGVSKRKRRHSPSYFINDVNLDEPISPPPKVLNQRRSSNRTISSSREDSQTDDQFEETYNIETKSDIDPEKDKMFEEIQVQSRPQKTVQYIVVKSKKKEEIATIEMPNQEIKPRASKELQVETKIEYETEVLDQFEAIGEESHLESGQSECAEEISMEGYSEFIFNGEKYVQMPKRLFEAEKDKCKKEVERYRHMLRKLKLHLNKMDLD
jgi:hypothetical protein